MRGAAAVAVVLPQAGATTTARLERCVLVLAWCAFLNTLLDKCPPLRVAPGRVPSFWPGVLSSTPCLPVALLPCCRLKTQKGLNVVGTSSSWGCGSACFAQSLLDAINRGYNAGIPVSWH